MKRVLKYTGVAAIVLVAAVLFLHPTRSPYMACPIAGDCSGRHLY